MFKYETVDKTVHEEWQVAVFSADDFFEMYDALLSDDESGLSEWSYSPTFTFENGEVYVDESWGLRGGRVYTSSYNSGVMSWNNFENQYILSVYGSPTHLGQLVSVEFRLDEDLKAALS